MFDPEALEAAKKFIFSTQLDPQLQSMPSTSDSERRSCPVDPLDKALAKWPGSVNVPRDNRPRLVKRNFKHQPQAGPRP